mmetsp:Transcript_96/g.376  ORF Transcript_96/g.376 Transcript_96/m.376 type:complete len:138 (+) Transcript_96:25-438(+)
MDGRRVLGEANNRFEISVDASSANKPDLIVLTSPQPIALAKGNSDASQLFTPGGCPVNAEEIYEEFGSRAIDQPKEHTKEQHAGVRRRGKRSYASKSSRASRPLTGGELTPLVRRSRRFEDEDEPVACVPDPQCTVS